jgi:hypothetical protein
VDPLSNWPTLSAWVTLLSHFPQAMSTPNSLVTSTPPVPSGDGIFGQSRVKILDFPNKPPHASLRWSEGESSPFIIGIPCQKSCHVNRKNVPSWYSG